jgi:hypothetical protein
MRREKENEILGSICVIIKPYRNTFLDISDVFVF